MNDPRNPIHFVAVLIALTLGLMLMGCGVGVPSKASYNVKRIGDGGVDQGVMVTLGPRRLLKKVSKGIVRNNEEIEIVDGLLFRDTAFPEGEWSLAKLLKPEVRTRVSDALNVDYLILLGRPESESGEGDGFFIPMAVGALSVEGSTKISALIIDLKAGSLVAQVESVASGTGYILHYVIFVVGNEPQTVNAAIEGLAKEICNVLVEATQSERVRIAIMAIEPMEEGNAASLKSLLKKLDEGDTSYELRMELARMGDSEPLRTLANEGDKQAAIDLYTLTGDIGPLEKLKEQGDPEATAVIAALETEEARIKYLVDARTRLRALAENADAQFQLYYSIETDERLVWACRAADNGNPFARYRLAMIFEKGLEGVQPDNARAQMWYRLAAVRGHAWGNANADRIAESGTEADSEEALRLMKNWQPGQCEADLVARQSESEKAL